MKLIRTIACLLFCCCGLSSTAMAFSYGCYHVGWFTTAHVLIVNPKEHMIKPVRAQGDDIKRETVAALANRAGASAAINGGFWKTDGTPAGILKIDHYWYGTPNKPRGAIGWSARGGKVLIDQVLTNCDLEHCQQGIKIDVIPVSLPPYTSSEDWRGAEHIVGGTPVLIRDGYPIQDYASEQTRVLFLFIKHPRTAVGIRENGDWVFVVVDGRFLGFFGGMTIAKLAKLMRQLGCVDALNLDGGGSSTMVIDGVVVNRPCGSIFEHGKHVDAVSDAILIFN